MGLRTEKCLKTKTYDFSVSLALSLTPYPISCSTRRTGTLVKYDVALRNFTTHTSTIHIIHFHIILFIYKRNILYLWDKSFKTGLIKTLAFKKGAVGWNSFLGITKLVIGACTTIKVSKLIEAWYIQELYSPWKGQEHFAVDSS